MKISRFLTSIVLFVAFSYTYAQTPDLWDGTSDTTWYNTIDTVSQFTTAEQLAGLAVFVNHPDTISRQASLLSVIPISLGIQTANQITSDFKVSRLHGVSWSSSAEDIIRVEGENAIVTPINQDTMVVLTVTLNELEKEFYFKVLKGSSIKEVNPQHISIYPNPANTILYIDNGDIAMQELLLYDVSGRLLKRVSVHVNTTSLDVSDLQNGIYLIKITTRDAAFVRKIQVVR